MSLKKNFTNFFEIFPKFTAYNFFQVLPKFLLRLHFFKIELKKFPSFEVSLGFCQNFSKIIQ